MTKQYDIIHLSGEMYMVESTTDIKVGDWFYNPIGMSVHKVIELSDGDKKGLWKKVIATTDKKLGLPLIPSIEEDIEEKAHAFLRKEMFGNYIEGHSTGNKDVVQMMVGFVNSLKKQYTEEDMRNAFNAAREEDWVGGRNFGHNENMELRYQDANTYLSTLKPIPTAVEVEMEHLSNRDARQEKISDGWYVPKVDKQNYIIVKKWIWNK